jgi:hypothetical protein
MQGSIALHGDDGFPPSGHDGRPARWRRILLGAGAAAVVIVAVIVVAAAGLDHDSSKLVEVSAAAPSTRRGVHTSTSAVSSSTSSTTSTSVPVTTTTTPAGPPIAVPGTTPPTVVTPATAAPTTTTTVPFTVRYTLEPNDVSRGYPKTTDGGPVLTWGVGGATRVRAYDDVDVFASDKPSGSTVVCPESGTATVCNAGPGTYVYTLDAYNARGARVLHRTLTLTIR